MFNLAAYIFIMNTNMINNYINDYTIDKYIDLINFCKHYDKETPFRHLQCPWYLGK